MIRKAAPTTAVDARLIDARPPMVTLPDRFIGIRTAVDRDVKFVIDLAKKFSNQLGFIPSAGLRVYTATGMVALGEENGMPAGYLLGRPSMRFDRSICPITQAAVCFDAQRCKLGLSLVEDLAVRALGRGQSMLQCWCAEDIDAMKFWPAAGFTAVARRNPANARGRWLTLWRRPLIPITRQRLFCPPPVAGFKAARAIIVDSRSATAVDPEMMDW